MKHLFLKNNLLCLFLLFLLYVGHTLILIGSSVPRYLVIELLLSQNLIESLIHATVLKNKWKLFSHAYNFQFMNQGAHKNAFVQQIKELNAVCKSFNSCA